MNATIAERMRMLDRACESAGNTELANDIATTAWSWTDGGKSTSKRNKNKNDCTVKAIAIAFGMPYDQAYDAMASAGRQCSRPILSEYFISWITQHTRAAVLPEVTNADLWLSDFLFNYTEGTYLVRVKFPHARNINHVLVVKNAEIRDTFASAGNSIVSYAWKIN